MNTKLCLGLSLKDMVSNMSLRFLLPSYPGEPEKIQLSDSFLPTTESAYKAVIYFKN